MAKIVSFTDTPTGSIIKFDDGFEIETSVKSLTERDLKSIEVLYTFNRALYDYMMDALEDFKIQAQAKLNIMDAKLDEIKTALGI
jgi:hypothetical protein